MGALRRPCSYVPTQCPSFLAPASWDTLLLQPISHGLCPIILIESLKICMKCVLCFLEPSKIDAPMLGTASWLNSAPCSHPSRHCRGQRPHSPACSLITLLVRFPVLCRCLWPHSEPILYSTLLLNLNRKLPTLLVGHCSVTMARH